MMDPNDMDDYVLEELDDEEYDEEELTNQAANFAAGYSNTWRSGSPSSSGYKTMGPYTYNSANMNENHPAVSIYTGLRERRRLPLCVVRLMRDSHRACLLDEAKG